MRNVVLSIAVGFVSVWGLTTPVRSQTLDVQGDVVTLTGGIEKDLTQRILDLPANVKYLVLSSSGGGVVEAMFSAAEIRDQGLTTYVPEHCDSACTLLFQAGARRFLARSAELFYHPADSSDPTYNLHYGNVLAKYGLDRDFVDRFAYRGGPEITLTGEDAMMVNAATQIGNPLPFSPRGTSSPEEITDDQISTPEEAVIEPEIIPPLGGF